MEGLQENLPELEEPRPIYLWTNSTKIPRGPITDVSKFAPGFMLQMDLRFSMLKVSVDLPQSFWLYGMILHTPLNSHPEASVHLLTY